MHFVLLGFVLTSLSCFTYLQFKSGRPTFEKRVAQINAHYATEFTCDHFLGRDERGFLFDQKNQKVCYFLGAEVELLDFDYFRSWELTDSSDFCFLFLSNDCNRPIITLSVESDDAAAEWTERLAVLLPHKYPEALAA
jgi:hypothetical protein